MLAPPGSTMRIISLILSLFLFATVLSQTPAVTGKYEGAIDVQGLGKMNVTAEIRETDGKLSGVLHTPRGDAEIIAGTYSSGKISITIDAGGDDILMDGEV